MNATELDNALYRYAETFLGRAGDAAGHQRREQLVRYLRSIVGSSIAPTHQRSAEMIVEDMQKRLAQSGRGTQAAIAVSRLFGRLRQRDASYDWAAVLQLLADTSHATAAHAGNHSSLSYLAASAAAPMAQQMHMQAYPPEHAHMMEIEGERMRRGMQTPDQGMAVDEPQPPPPAAPAAGPQLQFRELDTHDGVAETELLRDLVYVMQGVDGAYVRWNKATQRYAVDAGLKLSRPTREMVASVAELGVLARRVQEYVAWVDARGRLLEQSFGAELRSELEAYFKLVAEIEARLHETPPGSLAGETPRGATFRRVLGWAAEARARLRLAVRAIDDMAQAPGGSAAGGALLSTISGFVDNGDPFVQAAARRLLHTAAQPFTHILVQWVTTGSLNDPYGEFFVREASGGPDRLWSRQFRVVQDMIPVHYSRDQTRRIYQVGRSLAFLRGACADAEWVATQVAQPQPGETRDARRLELFIRRTAATANARLMHVLRDAFGLTRHVAAIRRLLLFQQGDFALALAAVLEAHGARDRRQIMAHDLSAALDSAVRSSNAQHEAAEHLAALVLAFDRPEAESWEQVTLRYSLGRPLSQVIEPGHLQRYAAVGSFLLRLKRIDGQLTALWTQHMTSERARRRSAELARRSSSPAASQRAYEEPAKAQQAVRMAAIAVSEMVQFFHQVQRFISLNVVEGAWAVFAAREQEAGDLDKWSEAHDDFVAAVYRLVGGSAAGFQRSLAPLVDTAFQFVGVVRELHSLRALAERSASSSSSSAAVSAAASASASAPMPVAERLARLRVPDAGDRAGQAAAALAEHAERVHSIAARFREQVQALMRALAHNAGNDYQMLAVSIDFNSAYTAART
ncbi:hypothetical protein LPJ53_003517 [Coemansia erecta]|uniref:Spindle pole body component n=1 Tax=Coemansia erecta TaxID=147472 RepID=A0A9W8CSN9_9FUNG|nr:hypothetical protein LPJ53_003517 [Coemansia erecta]